MHMHKSMNEQESPSPSSSENAKRPATSAPKLRYHQSLSPHSDPSPQYLGYPPRASAKKAAEPTRSARSTSSHTEHVRKAERAKPPSPAGAAGHPPRPPAPRGEPPAAVEAPVHRAPVAELGRVGAGVLEMLRRSVGERSVCRRAIARSRKAHGVGGGSIIKIGGEYEGETYVVVVTSTGHALCRCLVVIRHVKLLMYR